MVERTRVPWFLGALALTLIHCASDRQAPAADSPMPPPAEPPAEMTAAQPAASAAAAPEPSPSPGEVAKQDQTNSAAAAPKATPLSDEQIAAITDIANTGEIEQAKLARTKSKNQEVLKFSAMMIAHHGEAKQKQAKLKLTTAESATSTKLLEDGNRTLSALKDSKGADFDKRYMDAQVEGHQKVLDTINNELLPNAKSPELRAYLEEIKPKVEQHLVAARDAQQRLDSSAGARGTSGTSMK
jgi:putative membrane protein